MSYQFSVVVSCHQKLSTGESCDREGGSTKSVRDRKIEIRRELNGFAASWWLSSGQFKQFVLKVVTADQRRFHTIVCHFLSLTSFDRSQTLSDLDDFGSGWVVA